MFSVCFTVIQTICYFYTTIPVFIYTRAAVSALLSLVVLLVFIYTINVLYYLSLSK